MRSLSLPLLALPLVLIAADCKHEQPLTTPTPPAVSRSAGGPAMPATDLPDGLQLVLSDGTAPGGAVERPPLAQTSPLDDAVTARLLARLSPLERAPRVDFAMRPASQPPPRTGATVDVPFPPPAALPPVEVPTGPVSVLRWQPEGEVPLAPGVSVTFDRPMVALTTQDEAAKVVPVSLDPQPEGQWRWVGTRTLLFEPDVRMPMATTYTIAVPAGTQAADGSTVATAFSSTFATPPVRVTNHAPDNSLTTGLSPVIVLTFDQAVDAAAIREVLEVKAGRTAIPMRAATSGEIAEDPSARQLFATSKGERIVAVVPVQPLPKAANVSVTLPRGTPSAEGPLTTTGDQAFGFRTYGELVLTDARCGWNDKECRPGWPWQLTFSNPLDADVDLDALVSIEPPIALHASSVQGSVVYLQPASQPRTTYTVTVRDLRDTFGQALAAPVTAKFTVGDAEPVGDSVRIIGRGVQIPDPFAPPTVTAMVGGNPRLRVRIHRVTAADWAAYHADRRWNQPPPPLPGVALVDEIRAVPGDAATMRPFVIDLSPYTTEGVGQLAIQLEPVTGQPQRRETARIWVDATRIGLTVVADATDSRVIATDLRTGKGLPDVTIARSGRTLGTTDASGWLVTDGLNGDNTPLTGTLGADVALLTPNNAEGIWGSWQPGTPGVQDAWFVFDDRHLYRPGETVHVKGWIRRVDFRRGGDLLPPGEDVARTVTWSLVDAEGNDLGAGSTTADALGGFDLDLLLPATPNLGTARLLLNNRSTDHYHFFEIQEFRRPEFEVTTVVEDAGPHVVGSSATAAVTAAYFAGGALPGATVQWQVSASPGTWAPAGWDTFRFGEWTPWWWGPWMRGGRGEASQSWSFEGTTDATGTHRLHMDFVDVSPARPTSVQVQGTVLDVNRQAWTSTTSLLVHAANLYVGVRPTKGFYDKGDDVVVDVVAVDLDGNAVPDRALELALVHKKSVWRRGTWVEEEDERLTCSVASGSKPVTCRFKPTMGGQLELVATVTDDAGRTNRTVTPIWVAGGEPLVRDQGVEQEIVTLVPDGETYAIGDVAHILVQSPFTPAEGIVTWRRSGVVHAEPIVFDGATATIAVPIEEAFIPGVSVQVDLFGTAQRADRNGVPVQGGTPRPAYATGRLQLKVPPLTRTLAVAVAPAVTAAAPGEATSVTVQVRDARGKPVAGAQVALVVVDESVLSLTGYRIPDPLGVFYPDRDDGTIDHHSQPWIQLADMVEEPPMDGDAMMEGAGMLQSLGYATRNESAPSAPASAPRMMMKSAVAMEEMAGAAPPPPPDAPIAVRSDFRADALWLPAVPTDAKGNATVPLDLPDNLTRYRITAVVVDGDRSFGRNDADLTVRLPLMLRPSAPRFLNFGDVAELPLVIQNQTSKALDVQLAVRADNALLDGRSQAGRSVRVPANDRVEVRIPTSTVDAGRAHFQAAISAGSLADAATFDLPVWTPATTEAFATYGTLDGPTGTVAMAQPFALPDDVVPAFGGLTIATSTTQLAALTDAVIYLVTYPYECAEQRASRLLSIVALRDVLDAFQAPGLPSTEALRATVAVDLDELVQRQNRDGSWGFWFREERASVMTTLHVVHALVRAKEAGYDVDANALRRGLDALSHIDRYFDTYWSESARDIARAQALMIRRLAGQDVGGEAKALYRKANGTTGLGLEALGWLLPALHDADASAAAEIVAFLGNRVTETAATAQWVSGYSEVDSAMLLHGGRRTDAVLLDAMLQTHPDSDLLPKVVEGLLGARVRGTWSSTQENTWVLLALKRYFEVAEGVMPDLVARAWIGDGFAGEHAFQGRTTDTAAIQVPMPWLADHGDDTLVVARQGAGRLYYRLGLSYAPASLSLEPAERGFSVTRAYEAIDDPADVRRDDDGTWHLKAGARIRVTLRMVAPARRYHVALVDPLPAGLEVLNPMLATTEDVPPPADGADPMAKGWWWWGPWYDHENLRDERVEAFSRQVWEGVHTYRYVARATTLGHFVVPPAKAEEMYHPETFGRSGTDRVVVE